MAELTLHVSPRTGTGKSVAKKLRREGLVPAIVYGAGKESVPITVDTKSVTDLIKKSDHGIRSVFLLHLEGGDKKRHAMIKDMQVNPFTLRIDHIDFVRVLMDELVRVTIPIHLKGVAKGAKLGGIVDFQVREIHVECLPGNIPDEIVVDMTTLDINDSFRLSDIAALENVKFLDEEDRVVVSVAPPRAEEEEEAEEAVAGTEEPEVIKKGKDDEDSKD